MKDDDTRIVVGGGPAGASCALALAAAGRPVTVFERETQEHAGDKVCGEFLGQSAIEFLERLDFPWSQAGAISYRNLRLSAFGRQAEVELPFVARGVRRAFLDPWLLARAAHAGANVLRGQTVRTLRWQDGRVSVRTAEGESHATALFCATGKHALPGGPSRRARDGGGLVGLKTDFVALAATTQRHFADTLELFFFPGGYGGIARVAPDRITVCLLIQKAAGRAHNFDGPALLQALADDTPSLRTLLSGARPEGRSVRAIAALPYGHVHAPAQASLPLFPLGDQFAVLPSLSGTGIAFALASGKLAAEHHLEGSVDALPAYVHRARAAIGGIMRWALPVHRALQRPAAARVALAAVTVFPPLVRWLAARTRLSAHEVLA